MDIVISAKGRDWIVRQGHRRSGPLTFDELLGTVAALTMPQERECTQRMRTDDEWRKFYDRLRAMESVQRIKEETGE
jgi:hypothetical protein